MCKSCDGFKTSFFLMSFLVHCIGYHMKWMLNWAVFSFPTILYWVLPLPWNLWYFSPSMLIMFRNLLCGMHCSEHVAWIISFCPHSSQLPCEEMEFSCAVCSGCTFISMLWISSFLFLGPYCSVLIIRAEMCFPLEKV